MVIYPVQICWESFHSCLIRSAFCQGTPRLATLKKNYSFSCSANKWKLGTSAWMIRHQVTEIVFDLWNKISPSTRQKESFTCTCRCASETISPTCHLTLAGSLGIPVLWVLVCPRAAGLHWSRWDWWLGEQGLHSGASWACWRHGGRRALQDGAGRAGSGQLGSLPNEVGRGWAASSGRGWSSQRDRVIPMELTAQPIELPAWNQALKPAKGHRGRGTLLIKGLLSVFCLPKSLCIVGAIKGNCFRL